MNFLQSLSLVALNHMLPLDTFTYLCPARNVTSWLDHMVCSHQLESTITDMRVDYEGAIFDHFPLYVDLKFDIEFVSYKKDLSFMRFVDWRKMTEADDNEMRRKIDDGINDIDMFNMDIFSCSSGDCSDDDHHNRIDKVFLKMKVLLLDSTSDFSFDKVNSFKVIPGWNEHVKESYASAREKFLIWKENDKPMDGPCLENMRNSRTLFKSAFQKCKDNEDQIRGENLLKNLDGKKHREFWDEVYKINKNKNDQLYHIDKETDPESIANSFSGKYKEILASQGKHESNAQDFKIDPNELKKNIPHSLFSRADIHAAIKKLKPSIGFDGIHSNHLKKCTYLYEKCISDLFNCFILHSYVSLDILKGTINPTVKNQYEDLQSSDNYRPVMSSSIFLKLFEYCILEKIANDISLNDRQHGFRSNYSTSTACFTLKETILNYTESSSNVYACFIDISKAFDSVDHKILMEKLFAYGIPVSYINIIQYWYSHQFVRVRYGSKFSNEWRICNGVRQGGVLSGLFFSIYIDALINKISNSKYGCKLGVVRSSIIAYADDIVLLAPSATGLQALIDIAHKEANELNLSFNIGKSKCMIFRYSGYKRTVNKSFTIGDTPLKVVTSFEYLGYIINNDMRNNDDIDKSRNKFYKQFNVILRKFSFADIRIKVFLFQQYCIQFYGSELWFNNKGSLSNLKQFATGYHKAIKKMLGVSTHESNHFACQETRLLTFENQINKDKILFALRLKTSLCSFICKIRPFLSVFSMLFRNVSDIMFSKYDIDFLTDNDRDAIIARIYFVQRHEPQMRGPWEEAQV